MSNELQLTGTIKEILPIESGVSKAGKDWQKMNFVIDTASEFNPLVCFQIFGAEKCENFSKYNKVGDFVTVKFNVSSREWEGRYFHNLDAWRVEGESNEQPVPEGENTGVSNGLPF
jgi:hypothetical protein|tara:strand:- start:978 stop:1325 length:348 start_codon:yes stop_codon:yes gene_type:complete